MEPKKDSRKELIKYHNFLISKGVNLTGISVDDYYNEITPSETLTRIIRNQKPPLATE